jgi:hypothetical protein
VWELKLSPDFNREDYLNRMQQFIQQNVDTYTKHNLELWYKGEEINYGEVIKAIRAESNN